MNRDITNTVGHRLCLRRKALGLSQEQTAERAGVHPTYIGQVERGEKNPTITSIAKICSALDYPMEQLFEKIIETNEPDDSTRIPKECYDLILEQKQEDQEMLQKILESTIAYKAN